MKALVTGGLGFVGSNLVDRLINSGWQVLVVDDLSSGKEEYKNPEAEYVIDDFKYTLQEPDESIDVVFHLLIQEHEVFFYSIITFQIFYCRNHAM